ncbi:MAG: hypothetical protein JWP87_5461 [Labilithrix sp.]|nr:hypothetical protein [Labilithrix sp.]
MAAPIKVGITAWTDKSLVASGFYPKGASTAEARLRYYASQFPITENDSTYYALPLPEHAARWVERTPDDFTMNVKAFAPLTAHYTDPKRLPSDLRAALRAGVREKARVYPKDLGEELMEEIAARFRGALEPLRASGKLGVVLFQYPVWIAFSAENRRRLARAKTLVPGCRVAVELRNATWMSERNRERTLAFLRDQELAYTCVDEPQGFPSSIPPVAAATSDVAVVRFHGRSSATCTAKSQTATERFRYCYSVDELREWVPRIEQLAAETKQVHVLMNNCYSNYPVTNANQLRELLSESAVVTAGARRRAAG